MCSDTNAKRLAASAPPTKVAKRWCSLSKHSLSSRPLTETGAEPLMLLKKLGKPAHRAIFSKLAGLKDPSLSRLIDRLAHVGLVKRLRYPGDRRASCVLLTEKGFEVANVVEVRLADLRSRALATISDDDLDTTIKVLQAFFNAEQAQL